MNFLAHLYLSGESEGVKTGNFIGDYVKGTKFEQYQGDIRRGILLHRAIDDFTDRNPHFNRAKTLFSPHFRRYAGIVTDVVFDHFLAKNWSGYSPVRLRDFSRHSHAMLLSQYLKLPFKVQQFLPFMIQNRRLESYATTEGLEKALRIMSDYTTLPPGSRQAVETVEIHHEQLTLFFVAFMEEIIDQVEKVHGITIMRPQ